MQENGTEHQGPQIKRGQIWRDSDGASHLIVGRSKSKGFVSWSYAVSKLVLVDTGTLTSLLQDVSPPRDANNRPTIPSAGAFAWSPQEGYQQARGATVGEMGITELVRMEDAQAAISDAVAQRDSAIAAVGALREALDTFRGALDAGFDAVQSGSSNNGKRE